MLHVRVVSQDAATSRLVALLSQQSGVRAVVVQAGAANLPPGDLVSFDVSVAAANPVLRTLRELGIDAAGAISVERIDAAPVPRARRHGHGPLRREVAPVWELVEAAIRDGEAYAPSFYVLLAIAGLIGAVGILTNSQILIVAAMVVGPEYSAIIAVALGISEKNSRAVRDGLLALSFGFLGAIAVTLLFGLVVRTSGETPEAFVDGVRPVADLINSPDVFSVVVAVLAGLAGVVSLGETRASTLIGVFISVTTIPAAASIGVSIAYGGWREVLGSLLQLLLNVVLLIAVGAGGLRIQRWFWREPR
jgi:uncharacterized hydrophobic protein (TIGR00271 family)